MARYFFDFYDGDLTRDQHGVECAGFPECLFGNKLCDLSRL